VIFVEVKSSKPTLMANAKDVLAKRKDEGELGYEQSQALENTQRFATTETSKADKIVEKLMKNGKISEELAVKIVDIHPTNPATLRAILVKDRVEMSDGEIEETLKELA
jgi:DNA-directed RNA polymerase subunit F